MLWFFNYLNKKLILCDCFFTAKGVFLEYLLNMSESAEKMRRMRKRLKENDELKEKNWKKRNENDKKLLENRRKLRGFRTV